MHRNRCYPEKRKFDLVIKYSLTKQRYSEQDGYTIRLKAIDYNFPLINNIKISIIFVNAIHR
jgi:hypothetical protein